MKFSSDSAYLFKVTPVYKKDNNGKDTDVINFKRLTFRTCEMSDNALATIGYFDVIPSASLLKYQDTWEDMVDKSYKIAGRISRTYNKETQKGYTNFYLDSIN